jgi:hypothetical protein
MTERKITNRCRKLKELEEQQKELERQIESRNQGRYGEERPSGAEGWRLYGKVH